MSSTRADRGMTVRSDSTCSDAHVRAPRSLAMTSGRCGLGGVKEGGNSPTGSVAELGTLVPDGAPEEDFKEDFKEDFQISAAIARRTDACRPGELPEKEIGPARCRRPR